jgi:hypothetical protein
MPIQKFRTTEEAREALWASREDAVARLRNVLQTAARLREFAHSPTTPAAKGVTRFRNIEAANEARDARHVAQIRES